MAKQGRKLYFHQLRSLVWLQCKTFSVLFVSPRQFKPALKFWHVCKLATDHGSTYPMNLTYCNSQHPYPALVLICEQSDKRESDITILGMKKPSSYILANLTKLNCIKLITLVSQAERWKMLRLFFSYALRDCGAGCQSRDTNSLKRRNVPFPCHCPSYWRKVCSERKVGAPFPRAALLHVLFSQTYFFFFLINSDLIHSISTFICQVD